MEYFDLVDRDDVVIGVTDKETAHREGHIHRIAAVYVFDKQSRLFMQEHLKSGGRYDNSIGGHVVTGESYEAAVQRESYEELGITGAMEKVSIFYPQQALKGSKNLHVYGLYEITVADNWQFIPNKEVEKISPLPIAEIVTLMNNHPEKFVTGFIYTMKEYLKQRNLPYEIFY